MDSVADLRRIVTAVQPALVVHTATKFIAEHRHDDLGPLVDANLRLGLELLDAMSAAGCTALINLGTTWQHFHGEEHTPATLYAATKAAFEPLIRYYVSASALRACTLELPDTYGPGDRRGKIVAALFAAGRDGRRLSMSPGAQHLDLLHIDDVLDAIELTASRVLEDTGPGYNRYALSSGATISLRELVRLVGSVSGVTIDVEFGARAYRAREVMDPWRGGPPLPQWSPRVTLEAGLRRLVSEVDPASS